MYKAWLVSFIRFPLLIIAFLLFFLMLKWMGLEFHFPFLPDLSAICVIWINVICFIVLHFILKKEGRSIREVIDFRSELLFKDILFGLLWVIVLYIPFVLAVTGTMFVMYGTDLIQHFQTVFIGNEEIFSLTRPRWFMWSTAILSLTFPFLNAPIEELMYRGYAQPMFIKHYQKIWLGILIPSIGFALQHIMFAASWQGALVYGVAFFVWGIGSGIIYYKQKRLFPLIICHFIVNIAFSIFPLMFLLSGVY